MQDDSKNNPTNQNQSTNEISEFKTFDLDKIKKDLNTEFTEEPNLKEIKEDETNFKEDLFKSYNFDFSKLDDSDINQGVDELKEVFDKSNTIEIPEYLKNIYHWAYFNHKMVRFLDTNIAVNLILFGNRKRLIKQYLKEISSGNSVLQLGHNYGDMLKRVMHKIGKKGHLDVIDIIPLQISRAYNKIKDFPNIDIWQQDASINYHREYDIICSYFLLHKMPLKEKIKVIDNILSHIEKYKSKAVFVEYNMPIVIHPLKPILSLANTLFQPFVSDLWDYSIENLAKHSEKFNWDKKTFFGKMYQKVVVSYKG